MRGLFYLFSLIFYSYSIYANTQTLHLSGHVPNTVVITIKSLSHLESVEFLVTDNLKDQSSSYKLELQDENNTVLKQYENPNDLHKLSTLKNSKPLWITLKAQ